MLCLLLLSCCHRISTVKFGQSIVLITEEIYNIEENKEIIKFYLNLNRT